MIAEINQRPETTIFYSPDFSGKATPSHISGLEISTADRHPIRQAQDAAQGRRPTAENVSGAFVLAGNFAPGINTDRANLTHMAQELKEITALYNISVAVGASLSLDDVIWTLYKESRRLIDTSNFAIILYDEPAGILDFGLVFDQGRRAKPRRVKLADAHKLISRVLSGQAPLLVNDLLAETSPDVEPRQARTPVRSWLGAPIFNPVMPAQGAQGVIAVWSCQPNAFSERDLWLLSAIGGQAAIALRNARLHEAVLAERDRVIEAQEEARRILARELHDGPTQLVSALSMHLDFCRILLDKDPSRLAQEIATARELAQQAAHQIRTLLFELRPLVLERQGLQSALELFRERRQEETGAQPILTLTIETPDRSGEISRQEEKVESALFAIVQETVNNALKHAQAQHIIVCLKETATAFEVMITDNGNGFDVAQVMNRYEQRGSLGMINIQERADLIGGELTLQSAPGQGTRVSVRVSKTEAERLKKRGATGPLRLRREV